MMILNWKTRVGGINMAMSHWTRKMVYGFETLPKAPKENCDTSSTPNIRSRPWRVKYKCNSLLQNNYPNFNVCAVKVNITWSHLTTAGLVKGMGLSLELRHKLSKLEYRPVCDVISGIDPCLSLARPWPIFSVSLTQFVQPVRTEIAGSDMIWYLYSALFYIHIQRRFTILCGGLFFCQTAWWVQIATLRFTIFEESICYRCPNPSTQPMHEMTDETRVNVKYMFYAAELHFCEINNVEIRGTLIDVLFCTSIKGKTFPNVEQLVDSLKTEKVNSILVDMYIPVKRKELFNGSWFKVAELLPVEISHGVLLQGESMKLADELSKAISANNVQHHYLQDGQETQNDEVG